MLIVIIGFLLALVGGLGAVFSIPPRRDDLSVWDQFRQPAAKRSLLLAGVGVVGVILILAGFQSIG